MNAGIFRLIFSKRLGMLVPMAETSTANGKSASGETRFSPAPHSGHAPRPTATRAGFLIKPLALFIAIAIGNPIAQANPTNPTVVSGSASFNQAGNTLTVTNTPNAIINWSSFSIGQNELTRFVQQNSASAVLNRVTGQDPSQILGQLQSNGRVFIINPNGVLFGQGAKIDVAGLVASSLNISNEDFLASKMRFIGNGAEGAVKNAGDITTPGGGQIILIAPNVENSGIITSPNGEIILAAGHTVELANTLNPALRVEITAPEGEALNLGTLIAEGGKVGMYAGIVKQAGKVSATSAVAEGGRIFLKGTQFLTLSESSVTEADGAQGGEIIAKVENNGQLSGQIKVEGTLSARGDGSPGSGGFIETSAASVHIGNSQVATGDGNWLIDPADFTIAASGGNISGNTLSETLSGSNVTILSSSGTAGGNGDIHVNDAVSWSTNTLTLTAARDVNINAVMTASGAAALVINTATANGADSAVAGGTVKVGFNPDGTFIGRVDFPGRAGTGFLTINGEGYTVINSLGAEGSTTGLDLQGMQGKLAGRYALGSDIDATATAGWNGGAGFLPVGSSTTPFTGTFDGLGHTIADLNINRSTTASVGLFGRSSGTNQALRNVGLENLAVIGLDEVGGLAGGFSGTGNTISAVHVSGTVTGTGNMLGGLVGWNDGNSIADSSSAAVVLGNFDAGGLVGFNDVGGTIASSFATGAVSGGYGIGGLVGTNWFGTISDSHATGDVNGTPGATVFGGLVGYNEGPISNSHATGNVAGGGSVGGLIGEHFQFALTNVHAEGSVTGTDWAAGGLVGYMDSGTLSNGYATGNVSGNTSVGGLIGANYASVDNAHATGTVYGESTVGGLAGESWYGTISNSYATGPVNGGPLANEIGGLVGLLGNGSSIVGSYSVGAVTGLDMTGGLVGSNTGSVTSSYATGTVVSSGLNGIEIGGLIGQNQGTVNFSYATGTVTTGDGADLVGGLVGYNQGGIVSSSYSTGAVSTGDNAISIGGLVGANGAVGSISNSYSTGPVSVGNNSSTIGGLVGDNWQSTINNSYSAGAVIVGAGTSTVGGLIGGLSGGSVTASYWDIDTSGQLTSAAGIGLTTAQMKSQASFVGWDFVDTWVIDEGNAYPTLAMFLPGNVWIGAIDNLWNTAGNWSLGHVPTSVERVSIPDVAGTTHVELAGGAFTVRSLTSDEAFWLVGAGTALGLTTTGDFKADLSLGIGTTLAAQDSLSLNTYSLGSGARIDLGASATLTIAGQAYTIIREVNALQAINLGPSGFYALGSDIDASATSGWNGGEGFQPLLLNGTLAGLGHRISQLTVNRPLVSEVGLFSSVAATGVVRDVGLLDANIAGAYYVGGLAGINSGQITNSHASGTVSGASSTIGGLVGWNEGAGQITNSHASGSISGAGWAIGGLVGWNQGAIENSYATSSISAASGATEVGGLTGYNDVWGGLIVNSHYNIDAVLISGQPMVTTGGLYDAQYQDWIANGLSLDIADYSATLPLVGGAYLIGNTAGLRDLLAFADDPALTFRLANDIDLASLPGYNILDFAGEFDGAGHMLSNVAIDQPMNSFVGVFGRSTGNIHDIGVVGGTVTGYYEVGGLVGLNNGTIINSYASVDVTAVDDGGDAGGLVGWNIGSIQNSHATGTVTGGANSWGVGGLVGYNEGAITAAHATGAVAGGNGAQSIGGLVGYNWMAPIADSYATGAVSAGDGAGYVGGLLGAMDAGSAITTSYATGMVSVGVAAELVGGLVGTNDGGSISGSYATGHVSGLQDAAQMGGLVGWSSGGTIDDSYATGNVSSGQNGWALGGLVGSLGDGVISNSHATGTVTGGFAVNYLGGLVGYADAGTAISISDSHATGAVTAGDLSTALGGLVGFSQRTAISNSHASGAVTGGTDNTLIGGLVGFSRTNGSISSSYATGAVSGGDGSTSIGGLVGSNSSTGTVSNSYATGTVSGGNMVESLGGLAGGNSGAVVNSYSSGSVAGGTGSMFVGGLVGYAGVGSSATASYWDTETSGQSTSAGGTGLTSAQMKQQASFAGWDFVTVWGIDESTSYPYLLSNEQTPHPGLLLSYIYWDGGAGTFNWTDLLNWSSDQLPTAADNVTLDAAGTPTILLGSGTHAVRSLVVEDDFSFTGGILTIGDGGGLFNGSLNLSGGTLDGSGSLAVTQSFNYSAGALGSAFASLSISHLSGNLLLPSMGAVGDVTLVSAGDLTLDGQVTSAIGNIAVSAAGDFINNAGASALSTASGRWLIYAADPATSSFGGLDSGNKAIWGQTYASYGPAEVSETGNRYLFAWQPTATFSADNLAKTYGDDLTEIIPVAYSVSGLHSGVTGAFLADTAADAYSGAPSMTSAGAAANASVAGSPYLVDVATGTLTALNGYQLALVDGSLTVNPLAAILAGTRVYDATQTISGGDLSVSNLVAGDSVGLTGSGTLASKNVGDQAITDLGDLVLTSDNYTLSGAAGSVAITPATLTVSATAEDKVYDGTTLARVDLVDDRIAADLLTVSFADASFADSNAGLDKVVSVTGISLTGTDAGNYTFNASASTSANIAPAALTLSAVPDSKIYDGSVASSAAPDATGLVAGDSLSSLVQVFDSRDAGSRILSVSSYNIDDGNGGNNYTVTAQTAAGTITPAALTLSASSDSKVYDATTASQAAPTVTGLVSGDTAGALLQVFDSRHAGSRILTVSSYSIDDGNGGNNYVVATQTATGTISPAPLTFAASSDSKTFDGTVVSSAVPVSSGLMGTDTLSGLQQTFDSPFVGTRTLSVSSGYTLDDGNGGGNYVVSELTASGTILADPTNFAWTDLAGGAWEDGTNWNQGVAPVSGSDVVLPATSGGITYSSVSTVKTLTSASDFSVDGGSLTLGTAPGDVSVFSGADLNVNAGTLLLNGSSLVSDVVVNGGTLGGAGTIDGNVNLGAATLAPGLPVGVLTISGDLSLAPTSTIAIDLQGETAGTGYDVVAVGGTANLDGTLLVSLSGGYLPASSTTFDFLTASSFTGAFASSSLPAGFELASDGTSLGVLSPSVVEPPPSVAEAIAALVTSTNLSAVGMDTPIQYLAEDFSLLLISGDTSLPQDAAAVAALFDLTAIDDPVMMSRVDTLFTQLINDANMGEWEDESRLVCR